MPDVIALLPGICGSVLRKDGKDLWALSGEAALRLLLTLGQDLSALTLTTDPPDADDLGDGITAERLISDVHLIPYLWKIDGYSKVADMIKATFDVTPGLNYFEFAYDWRRDNRVAGRRLQRESQKWLAEWRASSGNAKARLILIAHSMGGLVSRHFLETLEGWHDTRALVTFGTPYRGSLNALDTLVNGIKKGPVDLSPMIRSLTSVYQLLPTFECYDAGDGSLVRVGETAGIPNVVDQRAAAALAFHQELATAVDAHRKLDDYQRSGYKIFPIVGIEQPTMQSARRSGAGVELLPTWKGQDNKGDGTVPRVSATPREIETEAREMFAATRHASLQNADAVLAHLQGLISSLYLDLGMFRAAVSQQIRLGMEVDDVYWHDEPVTIRVLPGREGIALQAVIVSANPGDEMARVQLRAKDEGWQSAEFRPLPPGTYRVTVTGDAGVEPVTDVFTVFEEPHREAAAMPPAVGGVTRRRSKNGAHITRAKPPGDDHVRGAMPAAPAGALPTVTPRVDAVLSAQAPVEISIGTPAVVDVRVELAQGAAPLAHTITSAIGTVEPIAVILSVDQGVLEIVGPRLLWLDPPAPGAPRNTVFTVQGKAAGAARIDVMFRQGASDLGTVSFTSTVVAGAARSEPVATRVSSAPRVDRDDDVLVVLVEEHQEGDSIQYRYDVFSRTLDLNYREFESKPILSRTGSTAAAPLAYVQSIYKRVVDRVLLNSDDLQVFSRELKAIGTDMCRQLLDPELVRLLWGRRGDISVVQVTSREPYIPWELLRLEHPDSNDVDDRFLGEYGLVRTFKGPMPPRVLHGADWRYLVGTYPNNSLPPVGDEVDFLTSTLPGMGIAPRLIPSDPEKIYEALGSPDFDVLHISCHGSTALDEIERTQLIVSDRRIGQEIRPVTIDTTTVRGEAKLKARAPLVFLNACETGQQAPSLTDWGGWPKTFWEAGAGAFVGTSWSVRERPAAAFSEAFYSSLLKGDTLAGAARAARTAAKAIGDASWLAFVVYGHPMAQLTR